MDTSEVEKLLKYAADSGQLELDEADIDVMLEHAPEFHMSDEQYERGMKRLHDMLTCPVCGLPKVHYRLYGYRCPNPEHNTR